MALVTTLAFEDRFISWQVDGEKRQRGYVDLANGRFSFKRMRILIVINSLKAGGAEKLIVTFINELSKACDYEIKLLVLSSKYAVHLPGIDGHKRVQVEFLGRNEYNPLLISKIRRKMNGWDIIHVHLFPAQYFVGLASVVCFGKKKSKLFFTEHNNHNKRMGKPFFRGFEKWIYNRYDGIIAITEMINKKLKDWTGHSKIMTIPNGLSLCTIVGAPVYGRRDFTHQLDLPLNSKLILMAARFEEPKRQDLLVEAVRYLPDNFCVLLAGTGNAEDEVRKAVAEFGVQGRVKFLGFRTDIYALMKSVDVNVLWSDYEGMSGAALEALASGKPFLGSDVPGIQDVVPSSAFLFEDTASLVAKITMLCDDAERAAYYGKTGREHVKQYDMATMVEKHIAAYRTTPKVR